MKKLIRIGVEKLNLVHSTEMRGSIWSYGLVILIVAIAFSGSVCLATTKTAEDPHSKTEQIELVKTLRRGGNLLFFRHERTDGFFKRTAKLSFKDCQSQRNLSAAGVASAKEIGLSLQFLEIPINEVWTSQMCRTIDTAKNLVGHYKVSKVFHSTRDKEKLRANLESLINGLVPKTSNNILVGHLGHIRLLYNQDVLEGDALVLSRRAGKVEVLGVLQSGHWNGLVMDKLNRVPGL
ncbi:MAG: hypothetical protein CL677_07940 [Bdellovibrionaceae bacterium]|nr:hypothetical protein [Pseudobdellovibrionaceae bacterium]|tara:strand:+ start:78233 stop:78940 length:708 start_codon:yes stop_codon:yes gene_type:complete